MTALTTQKILDAEPSDREAVLARARELGQALKERAHEIEQAKRIPQDVADALVEAGLFHITVPKAMGGLGLSPTVQWEAAIEIGRGCASSAWMVGLIGANLVVVGKFHGKAQQEVFMSGRAPIVPLLTGGVGSDIVVERVEGGYSVSGHWRYASGIDIASWVGLLVPVPAEDGQMVPSLVLVEQKHFEIDHDSWSVVAMRGTGSKNVSLKNAFVPEYRTMSWAALQSGELHPECPHQEPMYRLPLNALFAMSVLAPTLGVASGIVEEFGEIVSKRVLSGNKEKQIEDRVSQIRVGETRAWLEILRNQLVRDSDWLVARIVAGQPLSDEEKAALRSRIALLAQQALSVCQRVFSSVGGAILPEPHSVERGFRNIHGMASHFLLQSDLICEAYGRILLDLPLSPTVRL